MHLQTLKSHGADTTADSEAIDARNTHIDIPQDILVLSHCLFFILCNLLSPQLRGRRKLRQRHR